MNIPETNLQIPLPDGKVIHGKLHGDPRRTIVIFVHGLGGNMDRILPTEAVRYLAQKYSVLRLTMYSRAESARRLVDTTLSTHVSDLQDVIAYLRKHYPEAKVHVMGHSYGGLTALLSPDHTFDSAILLDPSHPSVDPFKNVRYVQELDCYVRYSDIDYLVGKPMVEEWRNLDPSQYLPKYHTPSLIISAGASPLMAAGHNYAKTLSKQTTVEHVVVPKASHTFNDNTARQHLFEASLNWLARQEATQ